MKFCPRCKKDKDFTEFGKNRSTNDGFSSYCRVCKSDSDAENYEKNGIKIRARVAQRKSDNPEKIKDEKRKEYIKHRDAYIEKSKKWEANNRERKNERARNYNRERSKTDIQFKLAKILRHRLCISLDKKNKKVGSAVRDLGCSIDFLRQYLESLFQPGMTWENHGQGKDKWHIDHIYPLSKFDLTDREQLLKACHYTNLQPLWAIDNIRKGNKV